jgi:hypothetical protein
MRMAARILARGLTNCANGEENEILEIGSKCLNQSVFAVYSEVMQRRRHEANGLLAYVSYLSKETGLYLERSSQNSSRTQSRIAPRMRFTSAIRKILMITRIACVRICRMAIGGFTASNGICLLADDASLAASNGELR